MADQGHAQVRDAVGPTRTETASPSIIRPRGEEKIPRNLVISSFEEKMRETDTAISDTATDLAELTFPDHTPNFEENKERFLDFLKLNEKEDKLEKSMNCCVGPTSKVDNVFLDLDTALPTLNNVSMGLKR